jgi:FkbM family methyltransferase
VLVAVPGFKYPVHLRLRTTDVFSFHQVLVTGEYDMEFTKPPRVIVDAGANIGLASVFYANKYPEAKIVAIEPESSNFEMLKKNTAPYSNVVPVHSALWRHSDRVSLIDPGLGHWGFQTLEEAEGGAQMAAKKVLAIAVEKLMADHRIDYIDILKLDIEGSEKEVFESPSLWIDRVGVIVIELHDRLRTGCSRAVYLATQNFEFEWRKGETVFLVRREYVNESPQVAVSDLRDDTVRKIGTYKIIGAA